MSAEVILRTRWLSIEQTTPQMQQFFSVMRAAKLHSESKLPISVTASSLPDVESVFFVDDSEEQELSEAAMLTALFGWSIVLPSTNERILPSVSRAASVAPALPATAARPGTPLATPGRSTPTLSTPRPSSSRTTTSPGSPSGAAKVKADTTLLFCPLCQRRVGLWAFLPNPNTAEQPPLPSGPSLAGESQAQPRRQLDILKEHRSYCPYVVRSTVVPTLPITPKSPPTPSRPSFATPNSSLTQVNGVPGAVEGWRAVMTVVLRYGLAQRRRLGRSRSHKVLEAQTESTEDVDMTDWVDAADEISQAEAMVEDVKTRGGRDLLKYVKGLLG
ncbi:hypothetical protein EIP86_002213 [Pleurotus ostreatoroseus]|nr:hypothetical protein EIP86_002213 [Pleurotus ostreatoroseus]